MEATTMAGQEQTRTAIKIGIEEMKAGQKTIKAKIWTGQEKMEAAISSI
jgi:hypothetical protein